MSILFGSCFCFVRFSELILLFAAHICFVGFLILFCPVLSLFGLFSCLFRSIFGSVLFLALERRVLFCLVLSLI